MNQRLDEGKLCPHNMASDFVLFQVASISALVGMTLGWRGVMTKYSGFYDLPTAWSNVFWGILIGGFYGSLTHNFIVIPYIEQLLIDREQQRLSIQSISCCCVFWHLLQFIFCYEENEFGKAVLKQPVGGHWDSQWGA